MTSNFVLRSQKKLRQITWSFEMSQLFKKFPRVKMLFATAKTLVFLLASCIVSCAVALYFFNLKECEVYFWLLKEIVVNVSSNLSALDLINVLLSFTAILYCRKVR